MARILVVEDDAAIRQLLRRVLERAGYDALLAKTASEGHRVLEVERVDVVITDGRTERLPQLNVGNAG
jgi:DNA-binding response OmpR family regulator